MGKEKGKKLNQRDIKRGQGTPWNSHSANSNRRGRGLSFKATGGLDLRNKKKRRKGATTDEQFGKNNRKKVPSRTIRRKTRNGEKKKKGVQVTAGKVASALEDKDRKKGDPRKKRNAKPILKRKGKKSTGNRALWRRLKTTGRVRGKGW